MTSIAKDPATGITARAAGYTRRGMDSRARRRMGGHTRSR